MVAVDGKDQELTLTDETQVSGGQGKDLATKFQAFKVGADVQFKTVQRGDREFLLGIRLVASGGNGAAPQARERAGGQIAQGAQGTQGNKAVERGSGAAPPQRAKVKDVDAEGKTITLAVGDKTLVLTVTDQSNIRGARGQTRSERLRDFEPGMDVMFVAVDRDGRKLLANLASVSAMSGGGNAGVRDGRPVSPEHSALKPINELASVQYQGVAGGFYPEGRNMRPKEHEAVGMKLAAQVIPRDAEGNASTAGKIVLLSIGISNAAQTSQGFQDLLTDYEQKNPRLVFVNGAGGMTPESIRTPDDGDQGTRYWNDVVRRLKQAGTTSAQVQVIWIKIAWPGPGDGFPDYAKRLQSELTRLVQVLSQRFPNAKLAYLSSRSYGGFAKMPLNPEPYAYESGFAVKWLIEEQIKGHADLNYDATRGSVRAPWLSWGPYLWANGLSKRSSDGLIWEQADFAEDGTHLSARGQRKSGLLLLDFLRTDSTAKTWFTRK